jgi:restriction endonuclease Mrr
LGHQKMENAIMHTVIRRYSGKGAKELFDLLEHHTTEIEELLRSVKSFVGYTLARSGDGGFSVTVCHDKAGIDESVQKAKDWIAKNAGSTGAAPPEIAEGAVILHLNEYPSGSV